MLSRRDCIKLLGGGVLATAAILSGLRLEDRQTPIGKFPTIVIGKGVKAAGIADFTCDGITDNIQVQQALDLLPNTSGGKILMLAGDYNFGVTVSRAIDNVTIQGLGYSTYIAWNGANDLFDLGATVHWTFQDIRLDAGSIDFGTATEYELINVWIGALYIPYLRAGGAATEDLRVPVTAVKLGPAKPPIWTNYKGGLVAAFQDQAVVGNEQRVYFTAQIPHLYAQKTAIIPHVHFVPEDNTGGNVRWALTYSWANIEAVFPAQNTIYVNAACGVVTDAHKQGFFPAITPGATEGNISSMLICELRRNSSDVLDTYNGKDAYLLEIDFHYLVDSLGSTSGDTKRGY